MKRVTTDEKLAAAREFVVRLSRRAARSKKPMHALTVDEMRHATAFAAGIALGIDIGSEFGRPVNFVIPRRRR